MKHLILKRCVRIAAVLIMLIHGSSQPTLKPTTVSASESVVVDSPCLSDKEISQTLELLSPTQSVSEQEGARARLTDNGKKSTGCRKRIISALMTALDRPNLDLARDRTSFFLWHYGARVLASLEAVEALDLLVAHLHQHDGTRFPLNHHPAVINVIRMGPPALPKLGVIWERSDPNTKQYLVFCIASIGGPEAKKILERAIGKEANPCVSSFLRASLDAFDKSKTKDQIDPDDRTNWYTVFLCNDI